MDLCYFSSQRSCQMFAILCRPQTCVTTSNRAAQIKQRRGDGTNVQSWKAIEDRILQVFSPRDPSTNNKTHSAVYSTLIVWRNMYLKNQILMFSWSFLEQSILPIAELTWSFLFCLLSHSSCTDFSIQQYNDNLKSNRPVRCTPRLGRTAATLLILIEIGNSHIELWNCVVKTEQHCSQVDNRQSYKLTWICQWHESN